MNPNMPLRGLIYFSRMYDTLVRNKKLNLYGQKLQKIPTPKYIVFYNGTAEMPEQRTLRLSDAFQSPGGSMELTATVYNINAGYNAALMAQCLPLRDYALFVAAVREQIPAAGNIVEAIRRAIEVCIHENIMADILIASKAEVTDMLLTEYDEAEVMEMLREEALEQGKEIGKEQGEIRAYSNLVNKGLLDIAEAAKQLETTITDFVSAAEKYGCPIAL